jgi:hypothetical protein
VLPKAAGMMVNVSMITDGCDNMLSKVTDIFFILSSKTVGIQGQCYGIETVFFPVPILTLLPVPIPHLDPDPDYIKQFFK